MLDNVLLVVMIVIIGLVFHTLTKILDVLTAIKEDSKDIFFKLDYKSKESVSEALFAEEDPDKLAEESLYLNKKGKFSYKVFEANKKKRQKEKHPDDFIDDFEQAAEELEKVEVKSKYAR